MSSFSFRPSVYTGQHTYGYNGPQFVSEEFSGFLKEMGVQHRRNTPLWPRANGEVERHNRTLLNSLRISHLENRPWRVELKNFLLAYRSTPHSITGASPAHLLFGREMRTTLPSISFSHPVSDYAVGDRDACVKQRSSDYAGAQRRSRPSPIVAGDLVLVQNSNPSNKLSPPYSPTPHSVIAPHGNQLVLQIPDHATCRNVAYAKLYIPPPSPSADKEGEEPATVKPEEPATEAKSHGPRTEAKSQEPAAEANLESSGVPDRPRRSTKKRE